MHSSFPRKDEKHLYRPVARTSLRHWLNRCVKICQSNPRFAIAFVLSVLGLTFLFLRRTTEEVYHHPPVVLVTVLERTDAHGEEVRIIDKILENRFDYATEHGYEMVAFNSTDFPMYADDEHVWAKLAALRKAMELYPHSEWFWYLDQNALIMNPSIPLHTHYLSPASLLALPLREVPAFPPETTIRTLSLKSQPISQINLILSHGAGILHTGSILIRSGDYANFILDSWNDPLVRSYGFPGLDHQALEHLVQWHPTILEGLAVMPKRSLLSFGVAAGDDEQYHEGDFVVHLDGCEQEGRSCEKEFLRYWAQRGSVTEENEQLLPQPNKIPKL